MVQRMLRWWRWWPACKLHEIYLTRRKIWLFGFKWENDTDIHDIPNRRVPFSMMPKDVVAIRAIEWAASDQSRMALPIERHMHATGDLGLCGIWHSWSLYGGEIHCKNLFTNQKINVIPLVAQHNTIKFLYHTYIYASIACIIEVIVWLAVIPLKMKTFLAPPACVIYSRWQPSTAQRKRVRMCRCEYLLFPPPPLVIASLPPPPSPSSSY